MEWISVDDRLPELFTDVFIYPHPEFVYSDKSTAELDSNGFWVVSCEDSHHCYEEIAENVTHWMPKPPPHKS